ncbi:cytidylate kinase-like family protein [bacterium]|nr:cytidylate kinase-like family protein [bacterium]
MSIITISRDSFCKGSEIAERLGKELGYKCVAKEILTEASEQFDIPETKLSRALFDSLPLLNCFTYEREKCLSYIQYSLFQHAQKDNIIYHGSAGHIFLKGVPHVLKVKVVSNMKNRISDLMKTEDFSEQKARRFLEKDDKKRRQRDLRQFGIDTSNMTHYDLVIQIDKLTLDDVVNIIAETSKRPCFQKTPSSQEIFDDLLKAAKFQSVLANKFPKVEVSSRKGRVYINYKGVFGQEEYMKKQIMEFLYEKKEYRGMVFDVSSVLNLQ